MLTAAQEKTLGNKLEEQLKYQEVYNELYDHFREAIGRRMQDGQDFEAALDEVYDEFGKTYGLERIEKEHFKAYKKRYRSLFLKSFTQISLPAAFGLALFTLCLHWLVPFNPKYWLLLVIVLFVVPMILYVIEQFRQKKKKHARLKSLRSFGLFGGSAFSHLFVAIINLNLVMFEDKESMTLLNLPQWAISMLVFIAGLYTLAYIRLLRISKEDRIPLTR